MYLGWDGLSRTTCNSGQEILDQTLGCTEEEQVVYRNGRYTCGSTTSPPICGENEVLTHNSEGYACVHTDVPTCTTSQVLTFNGSGYLCVARTDSVPTCASDQFLTYNGTSFQCASTQRMTVPTCAANEVLTGNQDGSLACKAVAVAVDVARSISLTTCRTWDASWDVQCVPTCPPGEQLISTANLYTSTWANGVTMAYVTVGLCYNPTPAGVLPGIRHTGMHPDRDATKPREYQ